MIAFGMMYVVNLGDVDFDLILKNFNLRILMADLGVLIWTGIGD